MKAPAPVIVDQGSALAAAERAAQRHPGCFAVGGHGSSMEPVYSDGTAVVVQAGGFNQLEAGTPVVYKNVRGVAVAHLVIENTGLGWTACGVNNDRIDGDLVTADNLVGVITQAFAAKTGSSPRLVATRLAINQAGRAQNDAARLGL